MKTSSAKAKGRRLQDFVAKELVQRHKGYCYCEKVTNSKGEVTGQSIEVWDAQEGDFKPAIMGEGGVDIKVSPEAMKHFPYDIECKNSETWSIPSWWKQTTANTEKGRKPLLVIKKNRHEPLVVMRWSDFKELL